MVEEHVQRYTTLETVLDVQGLQVCVTRIADFEELLESLDPITFAEDERLPYWAELWPAAVAMAHYMTERLPLTGRRVLELGCGLGLVGIVAALQGARVLSTDYEAAALAFARHTPVAMVVSRHAFSSWTGVPLPYGGAMITPWPQTSFTRPATLALSLSSCGAIWHVVVLPYSRSLGGSMRCPSLP